MEVPNLTIAWLAQGKLRVRAPGAAARTVESKFGEAIRDRALKAQQRDSWKLQGAGEKMISGPALWGKAPRDPSGIAISLTSLCRGSADGQILYSLETNDLCAVLAVENLGEEERRVWNKNDKRLTDLHAAPDGAVACSVRHTIGTANLAVRLDDEAGFSEVTEGDSHDSAPRWIPGAARRLIYQSAGVGRNREGRFAGLSPYTIHELDIENGEITLLAEDSKHDLLTPRKSADGTLYYIRRPYEAVRGPRPSQVIKDVFYFPFRLGYAIFQFLQIFSMLCTGKKLTSAGGPKKPDTDLKQMIVWGNLVSAENAERSGSPDAPSLVPKTWQLIRQRPNSAPEVLASAVLAFDLAGDGTVIHSNGSAIHVLSPDGKTERLVTESMIEQVAIIEESKA